MLRSAALTASALLLVSAAPAVADPDNAGTATRTLECDDGRTVEAVFQGEAGSNFNVTVDTSVFVYLQLQLDRPPLGPSDGDEVDVRGIQGEGQAQALVTCSYTTPSGTHVTATGFFTPRS